MAAPEGVDMGEDGDQIDGMEEDVVTSQFLEGS